MRELAARAVTEAMDLPADLLMDEPVLTLSGSRRLLVENQKTLLSFGPECIRFGTSRGNVSVQGAGLTIVRMRDGTLEICGEIRCVRYE